MIFLRYTNTFLSANCYILAAENYKKALVVDPGIGSSKWVKAQLAAHELELAAVLLTHGHPDHCWDTDEIAGQAPVYLAQADHYRLEDPVGSLGGPFIAAFAQLEIDPWQKPKNLQPLPSTLLQGGGAELVPGIYLRALAAPGHSEGSTVFFTQFAVPTEIISSDYLYLPSNNSTQPILLAGDVIFPTGAGRTDLLGADPIAMDESLRTIKLVVDPATVVFPGHGPSATMQWMIENNPYLGAPYPGCGGGQGNGCGCGGGNGGCGGSGRRDSHTGRAGGCGCS